MKFRLATLIACAALASVAGHVQQFTDPVPGVLIAEHAGELSRVEVFSTNATGTVTLGVEWQRPVFSNAVEIVSTTYTNCTVASSNRLNAVTRSETFPIAAFTPASWQNAHPLELLTGVTTNTVVTSVTNTWQAYSRTIAVTNAIVTGGTCTSNVYTGAPARATWIAPGDRIIFSGTALGGFIRFCQE